MDEALVELAITALIYIGKFVYNVITNVLYALENLFPKIFKFLRKLLDDQPDSEQGQRSSKTKQEKQ